MSLIKLINQRARNYFNKLMTMKNAIKSEILIESDDALSVVDVVESVEGSSDVVSGASVVVVVVVDNVVVSSFSHAIVILVIESIKV